MKFLADENIEKPVVEYFRGEGHDVLWIAEIQKAITDEEVLSITRREKRILLTNDKDFGELIFLQKKVTSGIVLLRFKTEDALSKVMVLRKVLSTYIDKLPGGISTSLRAKTELVTANSN
ncbi:DUF5615 family PIN-like protein [Candidatus Calescamantes bacterium]|nr:DUF5615 family PIN-like protein [Candidatus Calescamantes bacterium]